MPRVRAGRALILVALATGGGALALRERIATEAGRALAARGLTWRAERREPLRFTWEAIHGPGLEAEALVLDLVPRPEARVHDARLDLQAWLEGGPRPGGDGAAPGGGLLAEARRVAVDRLELRWGDVPLAVVGGTLAPRVDLRGPGAALSRDADGTWHARLEADLDDGPLRGRAALEIRGQGRWDGTLRVPDAVLAHPLLARDPLPATPLVVEGALAPDGTLEATLACGPVRAEVRGHLTREAVALDVAVEPVELADLAVLFDVPEATALLGGTLALEARVEGPPPRWTVRPEADELSAAGAIPDPDALRRGPFTWRAPAPDGGWLVRHTGEGDPSWTPLDRAGLVPAAVVAAEDARFWEHRGYDPDALAEVLDEAGAEGRLDGLRGASTITQQLAKNLFLDGRRTLRRKLRELIYALELEQVLGKRRILELYLNVVEFGPEIYGVRAAADRYFLKRPERLTAREAAFLAAILPSPRTSYERAYLGGRVPGRRIDAILDNMARMGVLDPAEAEAAKRSPLRFVPP